MQYESLIARDSMPGDLRDLKAFLGPDFHQHAPSDELPLTNWKHMRGGPDAVRPRQGRGSTRGRERVGDGRQGLLLGGAEPSSGGACASACRGARSAAAADWAGILLHHALRGPHPALQLGRYWNMTRGEYEHLIDLARRNTME